MMRATLRALLAAVTCATLVSAMVLAMPAPKASAAEICGKYQTVDVNGKAYVVQNNVWGASTAQCIDVSGTSFEVTRAEHHNATNGSPAAYPSIFRGCHWGNCTNGDNLPVSVSGMPAVTSDWSVDTISSGAWNAAYDLWYSSSRTEGENASYEAELMIWLDGRGVQPGGSRVASGVQIAGTTWNVWYAPWEWNYIAYVRTNPAESVNDLDLRAFTQDAVNRGYIQPSWYLLAVEAGFELWQGGAGLRTNSFSVNATSDDDGDGDGGGDGGSEPPAGDCAIDYRVADEWGSGFTAYITITNGATAVDNWTLGFDLTSGQRLTNGWSGHWSQSGSHVTVTNKDWNGSLESGESTEIGFNATHTGDNLSPTGFTLNGAGCTTS